MQKKLIIYLSIILSLFWTQNSYAICPTGTVTSSVSSTANTCGGNGTVTVNVSPTTGLSLQLLKGGAILNHVANATSPYTWSSLQAGTDYQVRIVCAENNNTIYQTLNVTVAENYVPISDANISVTDVCTNFTQGGTISVNGVTGGSAPYQYSFYLSNDPAYDDTLSTYGTSNTMSVSQFGTYQIRVKDACGNYKTFTRTLSPTTPKVEFYWKPTKVCGSTTHAVGSSWYTFNGDTGAGLNENQYIPPGIKLKIQADNASGAVLYDGMYTGANFTYNTTPSHIYYVTTVNACGIVHAYIVDRSYPENYPEFNNFYLSTGSAGCGAAEKMTITSNFEYQTFWKYPLTVTVKNSAGTVVATQTVDNIDDLFSVSGLPMGDYTVTVTDSCGESMTKTATNPSNDPASTLSLQETPTWRCGDMPILSQTGTIQALIRIDGYVPDRANAVVKIISGPSNVGVTASFIDGQYWGWSNLSPGTYTVSYTSCGVTKTGTFTLGPTINFLQQSLTSTGTSFCSGGGNINSTKVYNGSYTSSVQLLNSAGTVIAENVDGNFSNITTGTYTTRMKIAPWCNSGADTYYIPGSTVVLTDSSTGPVITSSTGVVCEDGAGNPLSTGSAFLNLAGVAPYKIEYKKTTEPTWTTINNAPANTTLNGLTANTIYNVKLTDACGGSYNTTVNILTIGSLSTKNTLHPCYNAPYVLSMENYAGATYEWTNSQGTVVANTRTYPISNYTSAYDGTYVCKITWTNCVTRYVNVTLNGNLCGQPLGTIDAVLDINQTPINVPVSGNVITNDEFTGTATVTSAQFYNASGVLTNLPIGTATPVFTPAGVPAGTMLLNADGTYTYTPATGFVGEIPVNYTLTNNLGSTDSTTLTIKVIPNTVVGNDNPIAQHDTSFTEEGVSVSSTVLNNDSDPDGDALTVTSATGLTIGTATVVSGVNAAGTPVANAGTVQLNANGTYTYVPAAGFVGTVNPLPYVISDGNGGTATANIYITVVGAGSTTNNTFANDDANSAPKGVTMTGNVKTNDTDPEGNTTTVTAATVFSVNGVANGTALTIGTATVIPGVGSVTLNANGTYSFVPVATYVGTVVIPYTICDDGTPQACDTATLYLTALPSLSVCYETPTDLTTSVPVNHGITVLKRAGIHTGITTANDWPMVRNSAYTALESKTKGFVITRNASPETTIANPVVGMMVFDTDAPGVNGATGCLKIYTGSGASEGWKCFNTQGCP